MARYTLPFLCLIGLTTTAVFAENTNHTLYIQKGRDLLLGQVDREEQSEITTCELTFNNTKKVIVYSKSNRDLVNDRFEVDTYYKCRTYIYTVNETDEGVWNVATITKKKNYNRLYNVKVRQRYQKKQAVPSDHVWAYPGQLVSVHFNDVFDNLESCMLLSPTKFEYNLSSGSSADIKQLGQCGFKMVTTKSFAGKWTLIADLDNNTAFYIEVEVVVENPEDLKPKPLNLAFKRGERDAYISLKFNNQKPRMCYMEDPHGVKYSINTHGCRHDLDYVTEYHEGLWKAYYAFVGMETLVEQDINVEVHEDIPTFKSNVIHSNNGDINLICQVRGGSTEYCSFVRPDGEILHITIGVGNEKYEYYGNGTYEHRSSMFDRELTTDCGVTIHKPDSNDYGSWRCLVKTDRRNVFGTVLKVTSSARSNIEPRTNTTSRDVYVKRGDSYTIKCKADEVLSYCWLTSPNGTSHSVLQVKEPKASVLKYEGEGLELGDCSALVKDANDTHNGEWTCHMGIAGGPEVEAKLNVFVTSTNLMASSETVLLESQNETNLICRPLPGTTKVIEACRWVNPLGHGINVDREGRYDTETGTMHCKLSIRVINYEEDVGNWSCFARFSNSDGEEESANMVVVYRSDFGYGNVLTIALCTSALVTISIGIFIIVIYKRRLAAMSDLEKKIILEKPSKFP